MRVEKRVLNDALRVLGKVVCQTSPVELYRSVRFVGDADGVRAMVTDGVETVSVKLDAFTESEVDFGLAFKDIKELLRVSRSEVVELTGQHIEFPALDEPSTDAVTVVLPINFSELLALAAPIVERHGYRLILQGINLSSAGVTVTDGKQLLHLPCPLALTKDVTIPFPSALLAAKPAEPGTLRVWNNLFEVEIGNFSWRGRVLEGQYPNWRSVVPPTEGHDYSITLHEVEDVLEWVKMIPGQKTTNGVELNVLPDGSVTLVSCIQPNFKLNTSATVTGTRPRAVLTLDREILIRMLMQGYYTFKAHSDGMVPVLASGGAGVYIAMPIRTIRTNPINPEHKEEEKMEVTNHVVEQTTAPVANPLDELGVAIEEFKLKIKAMFEESTVLSRKVKEVALVQKQKERDFVQARRAIERIRMAI